MKRTSLIAISQAILAAVLFGASAPLSKVFLQRVDPISLAGLLYIGSGAGAWLLFALSRTGGRGRQREAPLTRSDLPWLAGTILAGGVAAPILLLLGLKGTPASTAALLLNFENVATALIAVLAFREAVNRRILWALGLITLASILLTWTAGKWGFSLGALGILGACSLWGLDNNLTRQISAKDPLLIVGIKGLAAGSFSLLLSLVLGKSLPDLGTLALAMLVGMVCYGLSIQFFILALRSLGAARTSAMFGVAPFIGSGLSLLFLREKPQTYFWAALPFMLLGAWLMLTEKHRHSHVHEAFDHAHAHSHLDEHHTHVHPEDETPPEDGQHAHPHRHDALNHDHPHTPDLHHRHLHDE